METRVVERSELAAAVTLTVRMPAYLPMNAAVVAPAARVAPLKRTNVACGHGHGFLASACRFQRASPGALVDARQCAIEESAD